MTFDEMYDDLREGVRRVVVGVDRAEPGQDRSVTLARCAECGSPFQSEGAVVCGLDKILCVPCIGAALSRVTD